MIESTANPWEPIVHDIFAAPSRTWQYVVADRATSRCVLIDPVLDTIDNGSTRSFDDEVLAIVSRNHYKVDLILDTRCCPQDKKSAAWSLRMQLKEKQGYAPRVSNSSGGNVVSGMQRLFARKYGTSLHTNLDEDLKDGQTIMVGGMSVKATHLPGICTPNAYAYEIGMNIFGGHSVATLKQSLQKDETANLIATMDEDDCHSLWQSFQKILSLPAEYRLYYDHGIPDLPDRPSVRFGNSEKTTAEGDERKAKELEAHPYTTVAQCRSLNGDVAAIASSFSAIRDRGRSEEEASSDRPQQTAASNRVENSQKATGDSVPQKKASRAKRWFGGN